MRTPTSRPALAVTGATGALGGIVARFLADRGIEQRLLARTPSKAPALPGAVAVHADYADRDASRRALDGVSTLFMVSGSEAVDRADQHRTFVDTAVEAGVRHIVYTSFYGAAADSIFTHGHDHYATEEHIRASGMGYTFLRDNFYLDVLPHFVGEDGVIRGPAGDGRVAAVAREDIARVAVEVLVRPGDHENAGYDLTGPEALTMTDVAAILSGTGGGKVTFHDETLDEAYESRRRWNAPDWLLDAWVSTYTAIAAGELAHVTDHVARITGGAPLRLADLLDRRG